MVLCIRINEPICILENSGVRCIVTGQEWDQEGELKNWSSHGKIGW